MVPASSDGGDASDFGDVVPVDPDDPLEEGVEEEGVCRVAIGRLIVDSGLGRAASESR